MRKYFRSLALLSRSDPEGSSWFCLWSAEQSCFDFINGEPAQEESFRHCIQRCVQQSLGVQQRDLLVANMAQLNMEFASVLPGESDPHHVAVAFYVVNLYREASRQAVDAHPDGRWLSSRELLAGETAEGERISPILTYLLRRSEVIQAHHGIK